MLSGLNAPLLVSLVSGFDGGLGLFSAVVTALADDLVGSWVCEWRPRWVVKKELGESAVATPGWSFRLERTEGKEGTDR